MLFFSLLDKYLEVEWSGWMACECSIFKEIFLWFQILIVQFSSVQSLSHVRLFATPWTAAARPLCPSPTPGVHPNPCPLNSDAIQPSYPLSSPSPPALNLYQHQGFFQWVSSSHQVAKVLEFSFNISPTNEHPGLISFRMDWLALLAVQGTLKSLLNTSVQKHQFFRAQLSSESNPHIHTRPLEKPYPWLDGPL